MTRRPVLLPLAIVVVLMMGCGGTTPKAVDKPPELTVEVPESISIPVVPRIDDPNILRYGSPNTHSAVAVDLRGAFSDPEGEAISFTARTSNIAVVGAMLRTYETFPDGSESMTIPDAYFHALDAGTVPSTTDPVPDGGIGLLIVSALHKGRASEVDDSHQAIVTLTASDPTGNTTEVTINVQLTMK